MPRDVLAEGRRVVAKQRDTWKTFVTAMGLITGADHAEETGWRDQIRPHLVSLRLEPAREEEIVDESSQHLDERYAAVGF